MNKPQNKVIPRVSDTRFIQGLVLVIFILGLAIRLYDLTDLPLDFHPTRQLRSAIIARGLFAEMNPYPDQYQQAAAIQAMRSLEDYEPPLFEGLVAGTYRLAGQELLWISRIYAILFWLGAAALLFHLLVRWKYTRGAWIGLGIFLFAPFLVQASRSFQPDPLMVLSLAVFLVCLDHFTEKQTWKWAALTGLAGGIAILIKAFAGLFVILIGLIALISVFGFVKLIKSAKGWLIAALISLPAVVYYLVILGGRSGGFLQAWTLAFSHLWVDPSFYADWLHMIDSLYSIPLLILALIGTWFLSDLPRKITLGLWVGYFLYGLSSPFQFVTHTYYHLPLAILLFIGVTPLANLAVQAAGGQSWRAKLALMAILTAISGYYLWVSRSILVVDNYRSEPAGWQKISAALPKDGPVIALTQDYGNRLMYFSLVKPAEYWPTTSGQNLSAARGKGTKDFESTFTRLTSGKRYFLVTSLGQLADQPQLRDKLAQYSLVSSGDGFVIYNLEQPVSP